MQSRFTYWNYSPQVVITIVIGPPPLKADTSVAANSAVTVTVYVSYTLSPPRFHMCISFKATCFSGRRPAMSTPLSTADDDDGDDDDQTADNDDRRYDDDRHLCCAGYILDAEYVSRHRLSTNIRLSCIVQPNSLL